MDRLSVAFADGQAVVMGGLEDRLAPADGLVAFMETARNTLRSVRNGAPDKGLFQRLRLEVGPQWATAGALHAALRKTHPIHVEAGFEGNPGVEGGVWRPADGGDDALLHLCFSAGTGDLPLHIHEFSDRLIVVTAGIRLFHYMPDDRDTRELRSVIVEAGDLLIFTRGLIHTFTAPISDLTLLSYHSPFFDLDDPRQYLIPPALQKGVLAWNPQGVVRLRMPVSANTLSASHDIETAVR